MRIYVFAAIVVTALLAAGWLALVGEAAVQLRAAATALDVGSAPRATRTSRAHTDFDVRQPAPAAPPVPDSDEFATDFEDAVPAGPPGAADFAILLDAGLIEDVDVVEAEEFRAAFRATITATE